MMTLNGWLSACAVSLALCSTTLAALSLESAASGGAEPPISETADTEAGDGAPGVVGSSAIGPDAPPEISGPVSGDAVVYRPFSLRPAASDPDGDPLTFSISNLPAWASFDPASGVLFGTPQPTDVGVYGHIAISVSDGVYKVSLPEISVTVVAAPPKADSATLSWQAPDTNTDGTPLTDLAGYYIHYGTDIANLDQLITIPTVEMLNYTINNLAGGTYYFAVSCYTTAGVESALSAIVSKKI
jgi:hypothetical protein